MIYKTQDKKGMRLNMQVIKYIMLFFVFISASLIGKMVAKKYTYRVQELEEMKNALNVFKSKIKFTYEPIPEIFEEIEKNTVNSTDMCANKNIANIFSLARMKMETESAEIAWKEAIYESQNNLNSEDKQALSMLSKMLGQTDVDGQTSQIEITQNFLGVQIKQALEEKQKNEKLYARLGTTIGLVIVIILI